MARTLIATDNFTRSTDGEQIVANGNWAYLRDTAWQSQSPKSWGGTVRFGSSGVNYQAVRWVGAGSFTDSQYSKVRLLDYAQRGAGYWIGATALCSGGINAAADFYAYNVYDDAAEGSARTTKLIRVVDGAETVLGTVTTVANNNSFVEIEVEGSTIRGLIDGVVKITKEDTALTTGLPGFLGSGDNTYNAADDWEGGNITVPDTDTTAPTLTSPTSAQTGTTTASGSVSTDEGNGTLYYLASVNATETAATVKAGGATGGSQAVTGTGSQAVSVTGLTASTLYYLHFVHRDAAGNDSARVSSTSFTTSAAGDTTAPTLSSPTATQTGQTTASGSVSTNEANGTLYRYVSTNAVESAATVKAANLTQAVTATGVQNVTFTGLTAATTYYAHYVHRDAAGNDSTVANSASFTTAAAGAAGTITSDEFRNWSGDLLVGLTVENVVVLTLNRTIALALANQVTNGEGRVVIANNAALVSGTDYMLASYSPDGEDRGFKKVTAT